MEKLEKYVLITSFFTTFSAIFLMKSFTLGAPTIANEFLMNNVYQNWMVAISSILSCAFTIPAGQICSKYGCKKLFIIGCGLFILGLIMSVISVSSEMFIISRAISGMGYGLFFVSETAMIVYAVPEKNQGTAFGVLYVGPYIGLILAPFLGGYLINNIGWQSVFYLAIPMMIICTLIMLLKVDEEWIDDKDIKIDLIGCILFIIGIILFEYGFSDLHSFISQVASIIGIIVLILFGIYESKIELPVFNINLFKNKIFAAYNLVGFFEFFAIAIFDVIFSYYFQYAKGWDPQLTGLVLMIPPILLAIITPNAGKLSDKIQPQKLSTIGLGIFLIPLILLMFIGIDTSLYIVISTMVLIAIGTGLFSAPNTNAIMSSVSKKHAPYASATQITMRACGQIFGLGLFTMICTHFMGNLPFSVENANLFINSVHTISIISILLCILAIAFAIWGIKSEKLKKVE